MPGQQCKDVALRKCPQVMVMDVQNEECMMMSVHRNEYKNHVFLTSIDRKDIIIWIVNERDFQVILCW